MNRRGLMMAGVLMAVGLALAAEESPPPSVMAIKFAAPPVMDGKLDDACWQTAAKIEMGRCLFSANAPAVKTEAWIGYDTNQIYFAFKCPAVAGTALMGKQWDPDHPTMSEDDRVEIFLNLSGQKYRYLHFMLGASGARLTQRVLAAASGSRDRDWRLGWRTATQATNGQWTAEMAIPTHVLLEARNLKSLPFNVTRTMLATNDQFLTWAPVGGTAGGCGFHDPDHFGRLQGLENLANPAPACDPVILRADSITPYKEEADGRFSYAFKVTLVNQGGQGGETVLVAEDMGQDGTVTRHEQAVTVPRNGKQNYTMTIPVAHPADRKVRVALKSQLDWQDPWSMAYGADMLVTLTAYPNLSYYSGEPEGHLTIGCVYSDAEFQKQKMTLKVTTTNTTPWGPVVKTFKFDKTEKQGVVLKFKPDEFKSGYAIPIPMLWPVKVELINAQGKTIATTSTQIRLAPPPQVEGLTVSKIDHDRMCVLVNGRPFFPFGFWCDEGWFTEPEIAKMKKAGMNHMYYFGGFGNQRAWGNIPWDQDKRLQTALDVAYRCYQRAWDQGMYVIAVSQGHITIGHNNPEVNFRDQKLVLEKLPMVVAWYKNLPGLIAWMSVDEIDENIFPLVREQTALIRSLDPYHFIYASARDAAPWIYDAFDAPGQHTYWGPEGTPNTLAAMIRNGAAVGKMRRSPIFATPQGQRMTYHRDLMPDERRAGIWLALINGAKGIQFFDASRPIHEVVWRVYAYVAHEVAALAPILLEDRPPQNVVCTVTDQDQPAALPPLPKPRSRFEPSAPIPFSHNPRLNDMPLVQAAVWDLSSVAAVGDRGPQGELVVICNSGRQPVKINCALSSLGALGKGGLKVAGDVPSPAPDAVRDNGVHHGSPVVREYFSGKSIAVKDGQFTLNLEPYGLRILETVNSTRKPDDPVALGITAVQAKAQERTIENLVANGAFDDPAPGAWPLNANAYVVTNDAHSGARSLRMDGLSNAPNTLAQKIILQPNTVYAISLWAKQQITSSRTPYSPGFTIMLPEGSFSGNPTFCGAMRTGEVIPQGEWVRYHSRFTTRDRSVTGQVYFVVSPGTVGYVLVDDVVVANPNAAPRHFQAADRRVTHAGYEQKENAAIYSAVDDLEQVLMDPPAQPGLNSLKNSSFEEATYDALPDFWMSYSWQSGYLGVKDPKAYDGQYSLLLPAGGRSKRVDVNYQYWSGWQYGRTYTLSLYARAEKPGARIGFICWPHYEMPSPGSIPKDCVHGESDVGVEWSRVSWTFQPIADGPNRWQGLIAIGLYNCSSNVDAKVWLDAAQLEAGDQATPYKRDSYQAPKIDKKWLNDEVFDELVKQNK